MGKWVFMCFSLTLQCLNCVIILVGYSSSEMLGIRRISHGGVLWRGTIWYETCDNLRRGPRCRDKFVCISRAARTCSRKVTLCSVFSVPVLDCYHITWDPVGNLLWHWIDAHDFRLGSILDFRVRRAQSILLKIALRQPYLLVSLRHYCILALLLPGESLDAQEKDVEAVLLDHPSPWLQQRSKSDLRWSSWVERRPNPRGAVGVFA